MLDLLAGISKLAGHNVVIMDELREKHPDKFNDKGGMDYRWFESEIRPKHHIYIRKDVNSMSFTFKKGDKPGCDINAVIAVLIEMLHANLLKYDPASTDKKDKAIKEKHQQVLDNLLFAFKHAKELRHMEGEESSI